MYLISDFAFIPMTQPKWNKVLNQWMKVSEKVEPDNKTKRNILKGMIKFPEFGDYHFLQTKKGKRKYTTGIWQGDNTPEELRVSFLVGNAVKPNLKGAVKSLDKQAGNRYVVIDPTNAKLHSLYKKGLRNYDSYDS